MAKEKKPEKPLSIFDAYEYDAQKQLEGTWMKMKGDIEVKLAHFQNERAAAHQLLLIEQWRNENGADDETVIPPEVFESVARKACAKFVLLDWKNFRDKDGTEIPYSPEKALELLENPNMAIFRQTILGMSTRMANFRVTSELEAEKN